MWRDPRPFHGPSPGAISRSHQVGDKTLEATESRQVLGAGCDASILPSFSLRPGASPTGGASLRPRSSAHLVTARAQRSVCTPEVDYPSWLLSPPTNSDDPAVIFLHLRARLALSSSSSTTTNLFFPPVHASVSTDELLLQIHECEHLFLLFQLLEILDSPTIVKLAVSTASFMSSSPLYLHRNPLILHNVCIA